MWVDEPSNARVYVPKVGPFLTHAAEMEDMLASALEDKDDERERAPGVSEDWDGSTLRLDLGNDGAYVAGMSFASGETVNAEELRAAEEMLGAARFMASDLLKRGVKFPTRTPPPDAARQVVTETYDPQTLERLREQVETYARRYAYSNDLTPREVNLSLYKQFGQRSTFDEETCREAIEWLRGQP